MYDLRTSCPGKETTPKMGATQFQLLLPGLQLTTHSLVLGMMSAGQGKERETVFQNPRWRDFLFIIVGQGRMTRRGKNDVSYKYIHLLWSALSGMSCVQALC